MSLLPMLHHHAPDGSLSTAWLPKVETLADAEKHVRAAIRTARLRGGTGLRIDICDDLSWRSVWRARVKAIGGKS